MWIHIKTYTDKVKSDPIMWNHGDFWVKTPLFLVSRVREDPWNAWKKTPFPVKFKTMIRTQPIKLWHYRALHQPAYHWASHLIKCYSSISTALISFLWTIRFLKNAQIMSVHPRGLLHCGSFFVAKIAYFALGKAENQRHNMRRAKPPLFLLPNISLSFLLM